MVSKYRNNLSSAAHEAGILKNARLQKSKTKQHQPKLNKQRKRKGIVILDLIDLLASQECLFGDPVLVLTCEQDEDFNLIERSPESEDNSILFSRKCLSEGVKLSALLNLLRDIDLDGLEDSYIDYDSPNTLDWELYFIDKDEGKVLSMSSNEVSRLGC